MNNNTYGTIEYFRYEEEKALLHLELIEKAVNRAIKDGDIYFDNISVYADITEDVKYRYQEALKAFTMATQKEEENE